MKWIILTSLLFGASFGSSTALGIELQKASLVRNSMIGQEVVLNIEGVTDDLCSGLRLDEYLPILADKEGYEIFVHLMTVSTDSNCAEGTNALTKSINLGIVPDGIYNIHIFIDGVLSHTRLFMIPDDIDEAIDYQDNLAPNMGLLDKTTIVYKRF